MKLLNNLKVQSIYRIASYFCIFYHNLMIEINEKFNDSINHANFNEAKYSKNH